MEVDNIEKAIQCFKIKCNIIGNLKISCDITNSTTILWTMHQLLVYNNQNFGNDPIIIEPQFEIQQVIVLKDCLVCLDCSGNVNIDNKSTIESFFIWKPNVKYICAFNVLNTRYVVSLQYKQNRAILLINEFRIKNLQIDIHGLELIMPNKDWMSPKETCILVCDQIKSEYSKRVKNVFNLGETDPNLNDLLVIVSMDKRNAYAILFPSQDLNSKQRENITNPWMKLYQSCTDIIDMKIIMTEDIYIIFGLAGGNIIRVPLLRVNEKPNVYHLNTAINKFIMMGNTVIYSDVLTMWKNEDILSKVGMFEQFVVKNVRDFVITESQVICVTFSNLIYSFNINHRSCYIQAPDPDISCLAELVTNSEYLREIMETVHKNEELVKKINKETEYLMALSLSKRQDIMNNLIEVTASVFNDYRDIISKNIHLTLTEELDAYYNCDSYYFLINISVTRVQHKLNKLLSDVLGDIKIHITLFTHGVLKTTSIQVKDQLSTQDFVIPLKRQNQNIKNVQINVKIITNIPGKFDKNQSLWTVLYHKCIDLKAENFITMKTSTNTTHLKEDSTDLEMLIYNRVKHLYDAEHKLHIANDCAYQWTFFVKLPNDCNLSLKEILNLIDSYNSKKIYVSLKNSITGSKDNIRLEFQIGKKQITVNIKNGNLQVRCSDIMIALEIRNFFSGIIFASDTFQGNLLIDHKHYSVIEQLKNDVSSCLDSVTSSENFAVLLTRFLRTVYGLIPI